MRILVSLLCALAVSTPALADGVPVFTAGPALGPSDPIRQIDETKRPEFVKHHPIVMNKAAFDANVVTVPIDGKEYRFVGSVMVPPTYVRPADPSVSERPSAKPSTTATWSGRTADGTGTLVMVKNSLTDVLTGSVQVPPARVFSFVSGRPVMTEIDANKSPPIKWVFPGVTAASGAAK